jgi:AraC-like DNA-binding protein
MKGCFPPGFGNFNHHNVHTSVDLLTHLQKTVPIKWCRSLVPDSLFLHRVGSIDVNGTPITSHTGTAADFFVEDTAEMHLVACFHGSVQIQTPKGLVALGPNDCALLPTGQRRSNGHHSLGIIPLKPTAVTAAAAAMAGLPEGLPLPACARELVQPLTLDGNGQAARAMHSLMAHIDACMAAGPQVASLLGLDDVIHRSVAALRHPELLSDDPRDLQRWKERAGRNSFDALLDYIRANLDQPLRLSELEARSHYSRRALQYAFRERLNTTPKQWIREQRLKRALEQFQVECPRPSVGEVALACGYSHVGHFSRDFKAFFGISPSRARRS